MRSFILAATLLGAALAAPAPTPALDGTSVSNTDLIDADRDLNEFAASLEAEVNNSPALAKREYTKDTYNELTDGAACRKVTLIWARGTNAAGNVGAAGTVGPLFFNALATAIGGASDLAVQGVTYEATVKDLLGGGSREGATALHKLILLAAKQCPKTKIVVSGLNQGAQLVHIATKKLTAAQAEKIAYVLVFGDPDRKSSFGAVAPSKTKIICVSSDKNCDIVTGPTDSDLYVKDVTQAASYVAPQVK